MQGGIVGFDAAILFTSFMINNRVPYAIAVGKSKLRDKVKVEVRQAGGFVVIRWSLFTREKKEMR